MSRKDSYKYKRTPMQQLYDKLESMKRFGVSRKFLKENGLADEAITSVSTMKTYKKVGKRFITYMKGKHPNVTTLKKMKKYVPEYLQSRADLAADGKLSAFTVKSEAAALHKIFGIKSEDSLFFHTLKASRTEIKRSRDTLGGSGVPFLDLFCRSVGLRGMKELEPLKGGCLRTYTEIETSASILTEKLAQNGSLKRADHDELNALNAAKEHFSDFEYFVRVDCGKGGKIRFAPICANKNDTAIIVDRLRSVPKGERVFAGVSHETIRNANTHAMRGTYAAAIYHRYALTREELDRLPKDKHSNAFGGFDYCSRKYICRGDKKGLVFDRVALGKTAVALGHSYNRVLDVVDHYSYQF